MVEPRQSATQRIQVGIIGLVVVLLFVSLANMVLDRVTGGTPKTARPDSSALAEETMPDEPLAELGVTPVKQDDETDEALEAPAENIRQVPSSTPPQ